MLKPGLARPVFPLWGLALILWSLTGCASPAVGKVSPMETPAAAVSTTPLSAGVAASLTESPTHLPTPSTLTLSISSDLPEGFLEQLKLPASIELAEGGSESSMALSVVNGVPAGAVKSSGWVYAVVAPFPTVQDDVRLADLENFWKGKRGLAWVQRLLVTQNTRSVFQQLWGQPAAGRVQVLDKTDLLDIAWQDVALSQIPTATAPAKATRVAPAPHPLTLAIIPFEEIEPRWKVLSVDGRSPLDRDFDSLAYPLAVRIALISNPESGPDDAQLHRLTGSLALPTNYDPSKMTALVMTGTTAITRHIGERMEARGMTYPAGAIRDWLASADLTHISNEVSFYQGCPTPGPKRADMRFCSSPEYIELLEAVGTDIVELTGNHNLDWGYQPFIDSLEMYRQRGWKTYGGGANLDHAKTPLLVTHNGNRLAFVGCSISGPPTVWATEYTPGSAPCNMIKLEKQVSQLRADGYLPVVTLQAVETDTYRPAVAQGTPDFRRMARAGAVIVSGSQSHIPQTMTLVGDSFVHYGLGNLFFDQMTPFESRQEFIDQHVFYNGKYLGLRLLTALLEDYARPRPMTAGERREFLQDIFALCNWNEN